MEQNRTFKGDEIMFEKDGTAKLILTYKSLHHMIVELETYSTSDLDLYEAIVDELKKRDVTVEHYANIGEK